MSISNNTKDKDIPVIKVRFNPVSEKMEKVPAKQLYVMGPILLDWLSQAAHMPGKSLAVANALCWHDGMSKGSPFKLSKKAMEAFDISRDTVYAALKRFEKAGMIAVTRAVGQKPTIKLLGNNLSKNENKSSIKNLSDDG